MGANELINKFKSKYPKSKIKGYWQDRNGIVVQTVPMTIEEGYIEETLFFVSNDGNIINTTPIRHPIVMDKKITKVK